MSAYPGRIIVTEPKGLVQPRINVEKHSLRHVVLNGQTTLPCIAQGHPVPTYRYVSNLYLYACYLMIDVRLIRLNVVLVFNYSFIILLILI